MKKYFILFILTLFHLQSFSQGVPAFNRYPDPFFASTYNESNSTSDVVQLQNSDLLLTGAIHNQPALFRTDLNGIRKWVKVLYDSGYSFNLGQIILFNASTIYMLGSISYPQYGAILIKADTSGNIIWSKRIFKIKQTSAISMIKTYDDKFVIFASDTSGSVLVKIDTSGTAVWNKRYYTNYTPAPTYAYPYGGYAYDGPGNIIELPDHSITLATTMLQMFVPNSGYGYTAATIIKVDSNSNILWAKKIQPSIPTGFFYMYNGPSVTGVGDIFYGSDHNYILSMTGNYTIKTDSNANPIYGNGFSASYPLNFISEYPQGTVNIVENGGMCCGDVFEAGINFVFFRADIGFTSLNAIEQKSPGKDIVGPGPYLYAGHVRQLTDKRIVFTGYTANPSNDNRGGIILITDSTGNENCTSKSSSNNLYLDTGLHSYNATINTDTGITIQPLALNDSLQPIPHCNCDSLPRADFGISISGLTVYCHDSSQNALNYQWSFGDGTWAYTQNPSHTYATSLNYTITLQVSNNCGADVYTYQIFPSYSFDSVKAACNGLCNGHARAKVSGGTPPYTYSWNTSPVQSTQSANNLCPGTYHVSITDANNISATVYNVTIASDSVHAAISQHTNLLCHGYSNASATVTVNGGVSPYSFIWNSAAPVANNIVNILSAGMNTVTVYDADQCSAMDSIFITQPLGINITNVIHNVSCYGDSDGYVNTYPSGGTAPYSFLWDNNPYIVTPGVFTLHAGTHVLLLTDSNNCATYDTIIIAQPTQLNITHTITNVQCYNAHTGSILTTVSGGVQPYNYSWNTNPFQTLASISNLHAGVYILTVTDSNTCSKNDTSSIDQPSPLVFTNITDNASCYDANDGDAMVVVSGGIQPYTYSWNTNPIQTTLSIVHLAPGTYITAITDSVNCMAYDTVIITQPAAIADSTHLVNVACYGDSSGFVVVYPYSGFAPYTFLWNTVPPQTGDTAYLLSAGTYTVEITDSTGCMHTDSVQILQPLPLQLIITQTADAGNCTGTATAAVTGGTPPYIYIWSNSATTQFISGLCGNHSYTLQVEDSNGCVLGDSVLLADSATGVNNIVLENTITIVPNPFKNNITIDWSRLPATPANIRITNVYGATVMVLAITKDNAPEKSIDTNTWPPGFYFVSISDRNNQIIMRTKLVKE